MTITNELTTLKTKAVEELLKQREEMDKKYSQQRAEIDMKLAWMGYSEKPKKKKPCAVCGSTEHDGRAHKKQKSEQ